MVRMERIRDPGFDWTKAHLDGWRPSGYLRLAFPNSQPAHYAIRAMLGTVNSLGVDRVHGTSIGEIADDQGVTRLCVP